MRRIALCSLVVLALVAACATIDVRPTLKETAMYFLSVYNAEYDDTMRVALDPAATPAQKEMVTKKKAILAQMWPILKGYIAVVDAGQTPSAETTVVLTDLVNQLTAAATGGE